MSIDIWHCPKCGTLLEKCGEVEGESECSPVFQCEDCTESKEVFGEVFEVSVTFMVKNGIAVDIVDETRM